MTRFRSQTALAALIIFLTGCAAPGYHKSTISPTAPKAEPGSFAWPLTGGHIRLPFGSKEDGITLKGAVIEGPGDASVTAAADGAVVFVDEKMPGYGRTLILQHSDDFSTVYARNSELLVQLGDRVIRGQAIARAGVSGEGSWLYFEVRRKSKAEDPALHLA